MEPVSDSKLMNISLLNIQKNGKRNKRFVCETVFSKIVKFHLQSTENLIRLSLVEAQGNEMVPTSVTLIAKKSLN